MSKTYYSTSTPAVTDKDGTVSAYIASRHATAYLMPDGSFRIEHSKGSQTWKAGHIPDDWRDEYDSLLRNRGK